jgi:hypothetical protein
MKPYITLLFFSFLAQVVFAQQSAQTLPYTQDFEDPTFLPAGWQAFGSNGNAAWQRSSSVGAYGQSSASAFFDNFNGNLVGNYYGMRAILLDLSGAISPVLKFDVAYALRTGGNSDKLGIWYSFNGTTGWNNIINFENTALSTAPDQSILFVPTATQWDSITVDLSSFAGVPSIRLAFENNCANGNVIYIDNVRFYDAAFVGMEDRSNREKKVLCYPNPVDQGKLFVRSGRIWELIIHNQFGETIKRWQQPEGVNGEYVFDVSGISNGLYLVQMSQLNGTSELHRILIKK